LGSRGGLNAIAESHPDVHVTVGMVDEILTDDGIVLPGLGDPGDRLFGTPILEDDDALLHPSKRKRSDAF
jgi:uracil phosphoribosyltransferase